MVEREKARQDIVLEAKGDLSTEAEEALKKNLVTNALHHQLNQNVMEGEQQVMSAYEAAFRKIKEATGVGDVHEVIQKFVTQKDTEMNLMAMTREAQARIDQLADGGCLWSTNIAPRILLTLTPTVAAGRTCDNQAARRRDEVLGCRGAVVTPGSGGVREEACGGDVCTGARAHAPRPAD